MGKVLASNVEQLGLFNPTCMKCDKRVSVTEHLHNLSSYSSKYSQGLGCSSIPYSALLYQLRLGMLFFILSRLVKDHPRKNQTTKAQVKRTILDCKSTSSKHPWKQQLKLNKQMNALVLEWEVPCGHAEEVVDLASGRGYSMGQCCKFANN